MQPYCDSRGVHTRRTGNSPELHRPSSAYAKVHMQTYSRYTCTRTSSSIHVHKLGALFKLSVPYTVQEQTLYKYKPTYTTGVAQAVHAEHCTYTYSVHSHVHALTCNQCIALAAHAKQCTRTRTVCTPKNTGLRTIGTSLRPPTPNTVHVHVQCARPSTRAYVQ